VVTPKTVIDASTTINHPKRRPSRRKMPLLSERLNSN
jgi:hypothetical protein